MAHAVADGGEIGENDSANRLDLHALADRFSSDLVLRESSAAADVARVGEH